MYEHLWPSQSTQVEAGGMTYFKTGDKVRSKGDPAHTGVIIAGGSERILWKCRLCNTPFPSDDWADSLELIE